MTTPKLFQMPAYCEECKLVFPSGYAFAGNATQLSGNLTACPKCDQTIALPDGVFNFIDGMMELVDGSDSTREQLARMAGILSGARDTRAGSDQIRRDIASQVPEFASLSRFVPNDSIALATWLLVALAFIQLLLGDKPSAITVDQRVTIQATPQASPSKRADTEKRGEAK